MFQDLLQLLPSGKKENKLDTKKDKQVVNEIAELKGCTSCVLFEVRKRMDLYMWMAKTPNGPSIKFHVQNIHTMAELKVSGALPLSPPLPQPHPTSPKLTPYCANALCFCSLADGEPPQGLEGDPEFPWRL